MGLKSRNNRNPYQQQNFMMDNSSTYVQRNCLALFFFNMSCPSKAQNPETGQKTGPWINRKFLWMNKYVNTNLPTLEFFR